MIFGLLPSILEIALATILLVSMIITTIRKASRIAKGNVPEGLKRAQKVRYGLFWFLAAVLLAVYAVVLVIQALEAHQPGEEAVAVIYAYATITVILFTAASFSIIWPWPRE